MPLPKQKIFIEDIRCEILDAWRRAIDYYTNINEAASYFPGNLYWNVEHHAQEAALSAAGNIAKSYRAATEEEFQAHLYKAIDNICNVVSSLYLAKTWGYLRSDLYNELFAQAKLIRDEMKNLLWFTRLSKAG